MTLPSLLSDMFGHLLLNFSPDPDNTNQTRTEEPDCSG